MLRFFMSSLEYVSDYQKFSKFAKLRLSQTNECGNIDIIHINQNCLEKLKVRKLTTLYNCFWLLTEHIRTVLIKDKFENFN